MNVSPAPDLTGATSLITEAAERLFDVIIQHWPNATWDLVPGDDGSLSAQFDHYIGAELEWWFALQQDGLGWAVVNMTRSMLEDPHVILWGPSPRRVVDFAIKRIEAMMTPPVVTTVAPRAVVKKRKRATQPA